MPDKLVHEAQVQVGEAPPAKVSYKQAGFVTPQQTQYCRGVESLSEFLRDFPAFGRMQETSGHFRRPADAEARAFPDRKESAFQPQQKKIPCRVGPAQVPALPLHARAIPAPATRQ